TENEVWAILKMVHESQAIANRINSPLDPNYKNKYDFNEPHYRVNISYAYTSEIDIKESDGNKVVLHQIMGWDLVPLTDPNDQANIRYPVKRRNCEILNHRDAHPVLGYGTNNAIEAYVLSQALLNNSSGNYISCIQAYEMLKRTSAYVKI
ncbi:14534_t:CDS:2, partial [Funneliformis mosseae]